MTLKTYYAKLDCRTFVSSEYNTPGEYYKSFVDFMSYLTSSNVASLVSWNSGSGAISGSFNERTYPDEAKYFGLGAHSVWKFHTSSTRNWEWYLYSVVSSGSSYAVNQTFNLPISGYGSNSAANGGIFIQAAVCFSGTTYFNPWNGSISDGSSNSSIAAGNGGQKWISGSNDRALYVLPRSNDLGGTHQYQKSNAIGLGLSSNSGITTSRYHFIYDGDALLALCDQSADSTYAATYVGAYELRNSFSGSGIAGSNYGFMLDTDNGNALFQLATNIGDTTGGNSTVNGGIAAPIGNLISGSKIGIANTLGTFTALAYQPNPITNKYDEFPIYVGSSEPLLYGILGNMNTGLVKYVLGPQTHDVTSDFSRAVFGGNNTANSYYRITTPWTGSVAPGVGTSRTGSNFTWTQDYG